MHGLDSFINFIFYIRCTGLKSPQRLPKIRLSNFLITAAGILGPNLVDCQVVAPLLLLVYYPIKANNEQIKGIINGQQWHCTDIHHMINNQLWHWRLVLCLNWLPSTVVCLFGIGNQMSCLLTKSFHVIPLIIYRVGGFPRHLADLSFNHQPTIDLLTICSTKWFYNKWISLQFQSNRVPLCHDQ